jgi:AbrB family looped-hinge helix DNA binding protein
MDQVPMRSSRIIDKRGRITLPRWVLDRLGLSAGDRIEFIVESEQIILRPVRSTTNVFEKYRGVLDPFSRREEEA